MDMLLTAIPWSYLGPGTVLLVAILAIIRGDLVPRRQHEEVIRLHQQAAERERSTATQALSALSLLAREHGTTTDKILSALPVDPDDREADTEVGTT